METHANQSGLICIAKKELSKCEEIQDDKKENIGDHIGLVADVAPFPRVSCRGGVVKALDATFKENQFQLYKVSRLQYCRLSCLGIWVVGDDLRLIHLL